MQHNVRQLLNKKGNDVYSVSPDTQVIDALRLMAEKNIGALAVLENGKLCGIVSERDYARKVILHDRSSRTTPVRDIMTSEVVTVSPDMTMQNCLELMTEKRFRHLPVIDDDELVGFLSIGDVVKSVIENQQVQITHLENYITS